MYTIISKLSQWILAFSFFSFIPNLIWSQSTALQEQVLSEVEVTNFWKTPMQKTQLARDIKVISSKDISFQRSATLDQLLSQQAGIFVNGANQAPSELKTTFFQGARGVYTMYMIDGIPVLNPFGDPFEMRSFSTRAFGQVEFVSGGNSVLYGSSAIAGAINLVTVPYNTEIGKLSANGGFSYGSFSTFAYDIAISQRTNQHLSFNVGYEGTNTDGISSARSKTIPLSLLEKDGFLRNNFNAKMNVTLGKFLLEPFLRYSKVQYMFDGGAFEDNDTLRRDFQLLQAGIKASAFLSIKTKLHAVYSLNEIEENTIAATNTGLSHYLDVYAVSKLTRDIQLVGGVQAQQLELVNYNQQTKRQYSFNPYTTVFVNLGKVLSLEGGIRLIYDDIYHWDYATNVASAITPFSFLRLYASYSSSYLAPNLKQLYGRYGSNPNLQPEKINSYEVGLDFSLFKDRLGIGGKAYWRNAQNQITWGQANQYINQDSERQIGQEIHSSFLVSKALSVSAWYNHVDGVVTQSSVETKYLQRRPVHSVGIDVKAHFFSKLRTQLGVYYYSDRIDKDYSLFPAKEITLKGYTIINFNISLSLLDNKLEFFVGIKNLADVDFEEIYGYSTMGANATLGVRASL